MASRPMLLKMSSLKIIVICLFIQFSDIQLVASVTENCTFFANIPLYRGLLNLVPSRPASDIALKYCSKSEKTCCTVEVEEKLKEVSKNDYEKVMKKTLQSMNKMFKMKSAKFNEYFKDLMNKSKKDFHEMFMKTYGILYEENSYVFSNFYSELEKYFSYGKSNLPEMMDNFFNILYQKMFTVMNSQYKFDDKYLGCVSEHMNELKPFGDIPQKLSLPLKRSFVAARIYSQSLNIVGDVIENLVNLMPSENCLNAITKMSHCSSCKGVHGAKVCHGFCLNVMKGCLAFHSELDLEWNTFVDALHKVQQRLLGPFNLQLVVEPINVKISEAIMNFQESSTQVSNKVFNGCGKPMLLGSRRRRQSNYDRRPNEQRSNTGTRTNDATIPRRRKVELETNFSRSQGRNDKNRRKEPRNNNNNDDDDDNLNAYGTTHIAGFLKFIQEIGEQVLKTKFFWKRLPRNICEDEMNVGSNRSASCWNGNAIGSYDIPEVQDGLKNQESNREVQVDPKQHKTSITEQIYTLRSVSTQLKNAYNGHDVEWIDSEDSLDPGSGSGMFPDTDNFGGVNSFEGSGHGDTFFKFSSKSYDPTTVSSASENTVSKIHNGSEDDLSVEGTRIAKPTSTSSPVDISFTDERTSTSGSNTYSNNFDTTTITNVYNITSINNFNTTTSDGTSVRFDKMSLNQALATYLLPTVVLWIGGSFNEWSHSFVIFFQY